MRIAIGLGTDGSLDKILQRAHSLRDMGFTAMWSSQIYGPDTLTVLAIVGREIPDVDLGTAVVPIQPRHPAMLAAQARTVQDAIGGHLSLGIGLSHKVMVEGNWGLPFERPFTHMKEYVDALAPMLRGDKVDSRGELVTTVMPITIGPREVRTPSLLIAALGTKMLELAGSKTDGTLLWLTGYKTIASHIAPTINAAAQAAGRPSPRIVCALPVCVTNDEVGARERINETYATYATLPSYAAMLEREGANGPAGASLVGSSSQVLEQIHGLQEAGVTEFSGAPSGNAEERDAALHLLVELNATK